MGKQEAAELSEDLKASMDLEVAIKRAGSGAAPTEASRASDQPEPTSQKVRSCPPVLLARRPVPDRGVRTRRLGAAGEHRQPEARPCGRSRTEALAVQQSCRFCCAALLVCGTRGGAWRWRA